MAGASEVDFTGKPSDIVLETGNTKPEIRNQPVKSNQ